VNKFIFIFLSCILTSSLFAQEVDWKLVQVFPIENEEVWTVDVIGNVITSKRDQLTKYSPTGKVLFEQSQKSFGRLNKIEPINTLKFVAFSEQQQTLCFFDNSLTVMENCIELADFNIINATQFATSGQSDKLWVFDQVNSTLLLLSLQGLNQEQQVKNLMGILNAESITQMVEIENKLFFVDKENGIFMFDVYGTLINKIELKEVQWIQCKDDNVLILVDNQLLIHNVVTLSQQTIPLPANDFCEFKFDGQAIYFRSKNTIQKFEFLLGK